MKNLILPPLKKIICVLLSSMLLLIVNPAFAAPTVTDNGITLQQNVYLNKSTIDDLVSLKGIGHKKAQAILLYRQQIGEFTSVEQLINVKGVGEKVLLDNKNRLKI